MSKRIVIQPYGWPLVVFTHSELPEYQKLLLKAGKDVVEMTETLDTLDDALSSGGAMCLFNYLPHPHFFCMFLADEYKEYAVWHEALHVASRMINMSGQRLQLPEDDEQLCYAQGYIADLIKTKVYKLPTMRGK